jgi:hypothetical protein
MSSSELSSREASPRDAVVALARTSISYAHVVLEEAEQEHGDLQLAQAFGILLSLYTADLRNALRELVGPEPVPGKKALDQNPYTDPLDGRFGDMDAWRRTLTDEELREHCRYWNWSWENQTHPHGRWWCSKALSASRHELARRGLDPQSWRDGTEAE